MAKKKATKKVKAVPKKKAATKKVKPKRKAKPKAKAAPKKPATRRLNSGVTNGADINAEEANAAFANPHHGHGEEEYAGQAVDHGVDLTDVGIENESN